MKSRDGHLVVVLISEINFSVRRFFSLLYTIRPSPGGGGNGGGRDYYEYRQFRPIYNLCIHTYIQRVCVCTERKACLRRKIRIYHPAICTYLVVVVVVVVVVLTSTTTTTTTERYTEYFLPFFLTYIHEIAHHQFLNRSDSIRLLRYLSYMTPKKIKK